MNSGLRGVQALAGFLLALTLLLVGSHAFAVDSAAREVLSDERYRFCHEGEYPMFPGERRRRREPGLPEAARLMRSQHRAQAQRFRVGRWLQRRSPGGAAG